MKTELEKLIKDYKVCLKFSAPDNLGKIAKMQIENEVHKSFFDKVEKLVEKENDNECRILGAKLFNDFCNKNKKEKQVAVLALDSVIEAIDRAQKLIEISQPIPKENGCKIVNNFKGDCRCQYIESHSGCKRLLSLCNHCKEMEEANNENRKQPKKIANLKITVDTKKAVENIIEINKDNYIQGLEQLINEL